jgi:hypothetical protein
MPPRTTPVILGEKESDAFVEITKSHRSEQQQVQRASAEYLSDSPGVAICPRWRAVTMGGVPGRDAASLDRCHAKHRRGQKSDRSARGPDVIWLLTSGARLFRAAWTAPAPRLRLATREHSPQQVTWLTREPSPGAQSFQQVI